MIFKELKERIEWRAENDPIKRATYKGLNYGLFFATGVMLFSHGEDAANKILPTVATTIKGASLLTGASITYITTKLITVSVKSAVNIFLDKAIEFEKRKKPQLRRIEKKIFDFWYGR